MSKKNLTKRKIIYSFIYNHIKKLKVKTNDKIIIHADLSRFGIIDNNLSTIILKVLIDVIGKNGSIIMPSYTLDMRKNYIYDKGIIPKKTNISVLTKEFFNTHKVYRSNAPLHSHIGIGKEAKFLLNTPSNLSFGKNSDFYYMYKKKFKLILLGCTPQQGATYLHHLEALIGVPYRKWIKIKKKVIFKNKIKKVIVNYYENKNNNYKANFNTLFHKIKNYGAKINKEKLRFGYSLSINLTDLHKYSELLLKKNSYSFVKKV